MGHTRDTCGRAVVVAVLLRAECGPVPRRVGGRPHGESNAASILQAVDAPHLEGYLSPVARCVQRFTNVGNNAAVSVEKTGFIRGQISLLKVFETRKEPLGLGFRVSINVTHHLPNSKGNNKRVTNM